MGTTANRSPSRKHRLRPSPSFLAIQNPPNDEDGIGARGVLLALTTDAILVQELADVGADEAATPLTAQECACEFCRESKGYRQVAGSCQFVFGGGCSGPRRTRYGNMAHVHNSDALFVKDVGAFVAARPQTAW